MATDYQDDRHCDNCKQYTMHTCHDSGHERDSSNDWQRCNTCDWTKHGMSGKYYPPAEETDRT